MMIPAETYERVLKEQQERLEQLWLGACDYRHKLRAAEKQIAELRAGVDVELRDAYQALQEDHARLRAVLDGNFL